MTLNSTSLWGNEAFADGRGIYDHRAVTVSSCATIPGEGAGGIYNNGGTLTIKSSTVVFNQGGDIHIAP